MIATDPVPVAYGLGAFGLGPATAPALDQQPLVLEVRTEGLAGGGVADADYRIPRCHNHI